MDEKVRSGYKDISIRKSGCNETRIRILKLVAIM